MASALVLFSSSHSSFPSSSLLPPRHLLASSGRISLTLPRSLVIDRIDGYYWKRSGIGGGGGAAEAVVGCSSAASSCQQRQELFDRIAPVYDNLNDALSLGQHRTWKRMCVAWSGAKRGDRVLDLCCGSGDLAFLLSLKVGTQGEVLALDFAREQLSIASHRQDLYWRACYQNIDWIEGDALDLPFSDCYFDSITIGYGLRNLVDRRKAMKEVLRVLKPGSRVSILDFNKSTSALINMFQEWIIDNIVVPVASNYGLSKEYQYLKTSIAEYLTGGELEELAIDVGFSKAKHYEISGGFMGNLVAER